MHRTEAWLKFATTTGASLSVRNRLLALVDEDPVRALLDDQPVSPPALQHWRRRACQNDVSAELRWLDGKHCGLLTRDCASWPDLLCHIPDPPVLLFVRGRITALTRPAIAVVGSRNASPQGRDRAQAFAGAIAQAGVSVVSGLAFGIDASSHLGALAVAQARSQALTVAVMATGPDLVYPRRHSKLASQIVESGALVTEYRCGTPPFGYHFPHRNRIVSGLARATLVVEAALKSGSLITARLAAEQGRDVFAVPGPPDSPNSRGCHELIRSGAGLVESPEQFLEDSGFICCNAETQRREHTDLPSQKRILSNIDGGETVLACIGYEPTDLDMIVLNSGLTGWNRQTRRWRALLPSGRDRSPGLDHCDRLIRLRVKLAIKTAEVEKHRTRRRSGRFFSVATIDPMTGS